MCIYSCDSHISISLSDMTTTRSKSNLNSTEDGLSIPDSLDVSYHSDAAVRGSGNIHEEMTTRGNKRKADDLYKFNEEGELLLDQANEALDLFMETNMDNPSDDEKDTPQGNTDLDLFSENDKNEGTDTTTKVTASSAHNEKHGRTEGTTDDAAADNIEVPKDNDKGHHEDCIGSETDPLDTGAAGTMIGYHRSIFV